MLISQSSQTKAINIFFEYLEKKHIHCRKRFGGFYNNKDQTEYLDEDEYGFEDIESTEKYEARNPEELADLQ